MFCHSAATPDHSFSFRVKKLNAQTIFKGQSCSTIDQTLILIPQILLDRDFQAAQKQLPSILVVSTPLSVAHQSPLKEALHLCSAHQGVSPRSPKEHQLASPS